MFLIIVLMVTVSIPLLWQKNILLGLFFSFIKGKPTNELLWNFQLAHSHFGHLFATMESYFRVPCRCLKKIIT